MPIAPAYVRPADLRSGPSRGAVRDALKISGSADLAVLGRISEPYRNRGTVDVALWFRRAAAAGVFRVCGTIACTVDATCQRCLEPVTLSIESAVDVSVVEREADVPTDAVVDDYIVLDGAPLDVLAVVEDEVLLALPFAPRHEPGHCEAAAVPGAPLPTAAEENPFAVLAALKDDETE